MDKELLLTLEKSDSDDVVEEFKLPQPRTRRPRLRKSQGELRKASSGSFISLKCILTFFLITVFLSGVLLLAYFLLSLQSAVRILKDKIDENEKSGTAMSIVKMKDTVKAMRDSHDKKITELEKKIQDLQEKVDKINTITKKAQTTDSTKSDSQKISSIETRIQQLETGMASTGSDISQMKEAIKILQTSSQSVRIMGQSLDKRMTTLRLYFYNYTTQVKKQGGKLPNPELIKPNPIPSVEGVSKDYVRNALKSFSDLAHAEQQKNSKMLLLELTNLKTITDSINITHHKSVVRLANELSVLRNQSFEFQEKYSEVSSKLPDLLMLLNTSTVLEEKVDRHHKILGGYSKEIQSLEKLSNVSSESSPNFLSLLNTSTILGEKVNKHHTILNQQSEKIKILMTFMMNTVVPQTKTTTTPTRTNTRTTIKGVIAEKISSTTQATEPPKTNQPNTVSSTEKSNNAVLGKTTQQTVTDVHEKVTENTIQPTDVHKNSTDSTSRLTGITSTKLPLSLNQTSSVKSKETIETTRVPVTSNLTLSSSSNSFLRPVLPIEGGVPNANVITAIPTPRANDITQNPTPDVFVKNLQGSAIEPKPKSQSEEDFNFKIVNPATTQGGNVETVVTSDQQTMDSGSTIHTMSYAEMMKKRILAKQRMLQAKAAAQNHGQGKK